MTQRALIQTVENMTILHKMARMGVLIVNDWVKSNLLI